LYSIGSMISKNPAKSATLTLSVELLGALNVI
jgi:hypothetical protein